MSQEIKFGEFAGLSFSAMPSAAIGFLLLWIVLSIFAAAVLQLSIGKAILGGLVAALLHLVAEILHQLGHAWAARRTGHPMIGVRLWGVLSTAVYPKDEPDLPAAMHIQ